jgi:hypothetical protein
MREVLVASLIEDELRSLPERAKPKVILLDIEHWDRLVFEIQTSDSLSNTELKYMWMTAVEIAKKRGIPPSKVNEIECPAMQVRFRRNSLIQGIRILYSVMKKRRNYGNC